VIDKIIQDINPQDNLTLLNDLCDTMEFGSLCAMGSMTPYPVRSVINHFPQALAKPINKQEQK
jgi:formate dehydrogenase iron-sulfur subunit